MRRFADFASQLSQLPGRYYASSKLSSAPSPPSMSCRSTFLVIVSHFVKRLVTFFFLSGVWRSPPKLRDPYIDFGRSKSTQCAWLDSSASTCDMWNRNRAGLANMLWVWVRTVQRWMDSVTMIAMNLPRFDCWQSFALTASGKCSLIVAWICVGLLQCNLARFHLLLLVLTNFIGCRDLFGL